MPLLFGLAVWGHFDGLAGLALGCAALIAAVGASVWLLKLLRAKENEGYQLDWFEAGVLVLALAVALLASSLAGIDRDGLAERIAVALVALAFAAVAVEVFRSVRGETTAPHPTGATTPP